MCPRPRTAGRTGCVPTKLSKTKLWAVRDLAGEAPLFIGVIRDIRQTPLASSPTGMRATAVADFCCEASRCCGDRLRPKRVTADARQRLLSPFT
jgi:hypothetical protein